MVDLKLIQAPYEAMLEPVFGADFAAAALRDVSYQANLEQIFKDLPRSHFIGNAQKGVDDFVYDWLNTPSLTFTQGTMTASLFDLVLQRYYLNADSIVLSNFMRHKQSVSFAYYDDEQILCGLAFSYSEHNPTLWTAAIIRNTPAAVYDKQVLLVASPELLGEEATLISGNDASQQFLHDIGSKDIAARVMGFINQEAELNFDCMNALKQFIEAQGMVSDQTAMLVKKRQQYEALLAQNEAQKNELKSARQESMTAFCNPQSEHALEHSYLRRNMTSFINMALLGLVVVASSLLLSGVLAPLGIVILTGVFTYVAAVVAAIASIGVVANLAKISLAEAALSSYQKDKAELDEQTKGVVDVEQHALDVSFEQKCREMILLDEREKVDFDPQLLIRSELTTPEQQDDEVEPKVSVSTLSVFRQRRAVQADSQRLDIPTLR